ncbi:MAG: Membrane-associated zinc metalloprotease [Candidatus Azambacteria bacterium GW2011_GWA2_39_10]|uniref:Zinc metalloprotease n=1 Tax=Candidatus Azambacteria bacterium GW2011_GWA2_39_10 TaxID=1618611 RepID=A0A0G0NZW3_9BACT|nr:MAG: Membrane-associated zinc metalloprotease [Candidatus Azambacteria bacterium GW2011_GWA2_39_10]
MITLLIFILILGILVLVHEFGHFIVAKKSGLTVEEFGFGFPPRIFSFKVNETVYSINLLPLGGFVKILGEDGGETNSPKSFSSKSAGIRSLITAAGVMMNFALGALLLIIGFYIGLPQVVNEENKAIAKNVQIQIIAISNNSPAEKANLKLGDSIEGFGEISIFQDFINQNKEKEISLKIKRGEDYLDIKAVPRANPPEREGALGIALAKTGLISYPWYQSVWLGIKSSFIITWEIIKGFFGLIKNLITVGKIPQEIAGPVGIAILAGQATALGFVYLLQLVALISLNLAVLNLIPFPALDGGRLLFLGIEKIKGSKVNPKIENVIHSVGIVLLLALVVLITYRDILKLL